jgi:hypothetical protein
MQSMIWENEDITEEEAEALERQSTLLKIKLVEATTRIKEWGMQTGMERCTHTLCLSLSLSLPPLSLSLPPSPSSLHPAPPTPSSSPLSQRQDTLMCQRSCFQFSRLAFQFA